MNLKFYYVGEFMREIAKRKGVSLTKLSRLAEKSNVIDKELDKKHLELKYKDNIIIDGRISFYFIPNSIKIFLYADFDTRAKRIFKLNRKGETFSSLLETKREIKKREESERRRYKKYYLVDYLDKKNYDFVLDTTNLVVKESADKIIKFIKNIKNKIIWKLRNTN